MMTTWSLACVLALLGGDRERGMQLFAAGKYAEAAVAFRAAIQADGDSAELQWNLALACLRAGELSAAEVAAEKYAAMDRQARVDLHAGVLGAVRHAEAQSLANQALPLLGAGAPPPAALAPAAPGQPTEPPADPLPLLEQALAKCQQGRDHFVRGAATAPSVELQRNTERALRLIAGLEKQIEELKQQREQQKKNEPDRNQDPQKEQKKDDKKDDKKPDDKAQPEQPPKPDEAKEPGQQPEPKEPQPGDQPGEPKPDQPQDKPPDKPQDQDQQQGKPEPPKDAPGQGQAGDRQDAPGEGQQGREQSVEQAQRVQDNLQKQDQKRRELLLRQKAQRPRVERDW